MGIRLSSKEQEELVLENQALVHHLIKKLNILPSDYDDMFSIGTIGLIKAATTFDKSKNSKFSTYACRCINNEFFMYFRKNKLHQNDISIDDPISTDSEGHTLTLSDILPNSDKDITEEIVEKEVVINFISIILNLLEPRERLIMLYKIAGTTQRCIGKKFNIAQSYISRLEKKINNKVKLYYTNKIQFKEVFSMAIVNDFYEISFSSEDIKDFNKIFATFLQNVASTNDLPDFRVTCNKTRIIIQVPAYPESFSFIAQIIQEIDNYSMEFVSNKNRTLASSNNLQTTELNNTNEHACAIKDEKVDVIEENSVDATDSVRKYEEIVEKSDIISDSKKTECENKSKKNNQVKQVRDYMLSLNSFTTKQLRQHFPNLASATINNALSLAKAKGLIKSVARGQYKVLKD